MIKRSKFMQKGLLVLAAAAASSPTFAATRTVILSGDNGLLTRTTSLTKTTLADGTSALQRVVTRFDGQKVVTTLTGDLSSSSLPGLNDLKTVRITRDGNKIEFTSN